MSDPNLIRVKEVFAHAIGLSPQERLTYLDAACAGDPTLRSEVEAYLAAAEGTNAFLGESDNQTTRSPPRLLAEGPGTRIGRYKLLEKIGEGGFGTVFMAEQEEPVRRKVALKVIKVGMDTAEVIARFEAERQALAMMEHPHVAKVLDAGATDTGRPYFVMELVNGQPITDYCDAKNLSVDARLEQFVQVCQAVQHAHQKGLIHRDIKPSNVLVTTQDDRAVTKVIDFGVAKAIQSRLTEKTLFTRFQQLVGTPAYMSPEQADASLDIDTRSDVYGLGVLLYELLTGAPPFDPAELRSKAFAEMQRIIREVDPPRPSAKLSTVATIADVAAHRSTQPKALQSKVRGELEWIVMKCLEKDRVRRYDSAAALATDVSHYLGGLPVSAGAPSGWYKARKFVRRHRASVLVTAAFVALLTTTAVLTTLNNIEQRRLRGDADQQRTAAERSAADAREQRAISDAVSEFQTTMLMQADPEKGKGDKVTVLEAINAAVAELDKSNTTPPLVEANVRYIIAATLRELGRADLAEPNAKRALELRQKMLPPGDILIGSSISQCAAVELGLGRLDAAATLFEQAVAMTPASDASNRVKHLHNLAVIYRNQGRYDEGERLAREVLLARRGQGTGAPPRELQSALANLGAILENKHQLPEAETLAREALSVSRQAFPAGHTAIAEATNNLGTILWSQNRLAEAEVLMREAFEINRNALPAGHPARVQGLTGLAALLTQEGKYSEAEPLSRGALEIARKTYAANHPDLALSLHNYALLLFHMRRVPDAIPLEAEALAILRKALPHGHPTLAIALNALGSMYATAGDLAACEAVYREALDIRRAALSVDDPAIAESVSNLNACLADRARHAASQPAMTRAATTLPATMPVP